MGNGGIEMPETAFVIGIVTRMAIRHALMSHVLILDDCGPARAKMA